VIGKAQDDLVERHARSLPETHRNRPPLLRRARATRLGPPGELPDRDVEIALVGERHVERGGSAAGGLERLTGVQMKLDPRA
jgi:hypothetical protein